MALSPNLQARVTNILKQPASEWPVIAAEPADVASLLQGYAAPLAAIPAICRWIGFSVIGMSVPFVGTFRVGIVRGLANAIVYFVFALAGAYIAALVIEKLAPTFKSSGGTIQALKLVVYASTPVWVAGVLNLIPALSPLIIIAALYAVYVFYLGLPHLMHTPSDQVIPYMVVSALVMVVVTVCLGIVTGIVAGVGTGYTF
ncbi:MAG TPA: Yip1 family protein [Vicinamibacterales bacterium]|nr:Yip1 family protein [Vicinamibacterales bacterium]